RAISLSKQLDDRYSGNQALNNLFSTECAYIREKLKQLCETLILEDPCDYGQKVDDLLWRKVFYDPIQIVKRNHKQRGGQSQPSPFIMQTEIMYKMHLSSTFGFYSNLLIKLCAAIKSILNLNGFLDYPILNDEQKRDLALSTTSSSLIQTDTSVVRKESLLKIIHKCLMCLGDVSRYQNEYEYSVQTAEKFYNMALLLNPDIGMPLNQLGTLCGRLNYSCDSTFFYLLCLSTQQPFDGAKDNLTLIFQRNQKKHRDLNLQYQKPSNESTSNREIRRFLIHFLYIVEHLLNSHNIVLIQELGQETLNEFNASSDSDEENEKAKNVQAQKRRRLKILMSRRRRHISVDTSEGSEDEIPDYISVSGNSTDDEQQQRNKKNNLLQTKSGINEEKEAEEAAIKLALEEYMERIKQSSEQFGSGGHNEAASNSSIAGPALFSFKDLSTQLFSTFSSNDFQQQSSLFDDQFGDLSHINGTSASSVGDENSFKSILIGKKQIRVPPGFEHNKEAKAAAEIEQKLADFHLDTDTDISIYRSDAEKTTGDFDTERESTPMSENENEKQDKDYYGTKLILELIEKEGLLLAVKEFCHWLQSNKKLLQMLLPISHGLWSKLALLLNFLPHEKDILKSGLLSSNSSLHNMLNKFVETKTFVGPLLEEDLQLRAFSSLKNDKNHLKLDLNNVLPFTQLEKTIIRVCTLRRFGYSICSLSSGSSQFHYDNEKCLFICTVPQQNQQQSTTESITEINDEEIAATVAKTTVADERKSRLMRDMAQLRLQAEISQLENSLKNEEFTLPPYLVIDSQALCTNLTEIQKLVQSQRFIIIIPLVVIDILDELKKEKREAREAIRWLETQFRLGNRFIRTQATHERQQSNTNSRSGFIRKKENNDLWRFSQLFECCFYFSNQSGYDKSSMTTITLLIARQSNTFTNKEKQLIQQAEKDGVPVQHIEEFFQKWQGLNEAQTIHPVVTTTAVSTK
ncbi:unnamed protein product, partial [Didymodactylos carnosus]